MSLRSCCSGHENPAGRVPRARRVLAGHRAQGILLWRTQLGTPFWTMGFPCFSVAAPATCPGALRARIGLCRSPTRSPSQLLVLQAIGG